MPLVVLDSSGGRNKRNVNAGWSKTKVGVSYTGTMNTGCAIAALRAGLLAAASSSSVMCWVEMALTRPSCKDFSVISVLIVDERIFAGRAWIFLLLTVT